MNNRISINNITLTYILFVLLTVVLISNEYRSTMSFFAFVAVFVICLITDRDLENLSIFVLLVLINTAVGKIGVLGTSVSVTSAMYVLLILLSLFLFYQGKRIGTKAVVFLLLWIAMRVITHVVNGLSIKEVLWSSVVVFIGIYYFLFVKDNPKRSKLLLQCLYFAGFLICFYAFVELIMGKTFFYSRWTGAERYRYGILRVGSLLEDPNYMCLYLLPLVFLSQTNVVSKVLKNNVRLVFNILSIVLIFISGSRTAMLVLLATVAIYIFIKYKKLIALFLPMGIIVLMITQGIIQDLLQSLVDVDVSSSSTRMRLLTSAIDFWKDNVVLGKGYNSFYNNSERLLGNKIQVINTYITALVEFGIVGIMSYVVMFYCEIKYIYKHIFKVCIKDGIFILLSLISWEIMVFSLDSFTTTMFWLFPAIIVAVRQLSDFENGRVENNASV